MELYARLRHRLRLLVRSEHGMALPTALFATVASMGLAGAAVMSSVDAQRGSHRDSDSKSAIAAADAGASVALLRLNRYASALNSATPCLGLSGETLVLTGVTGDGWCPEVKGTVGGSSYAYRATPLAGGSMNVVATGTDGSVSRRIAINFKTTTVGSVLSSAGVIGEEKVSLVNSVDVRVGVGTNGNVSLGNSATICGDIRHGVGKKVTYENSSKQCSGYTTTEGNATLPSVSTFIPTDIATNNHNKRLAKCTSKNVPEDCGLDTYSSGESKSAWNPVTREIVIANSSTLTMGGGDYFICRLALVNSSHLIMAATAQMRIFFDTPENCPGASTTQLDIGNSSDITATGYNPSKGLFNMPGFYFLGSTTTPTYINFKNSSNGNEMVIYAPNTHITMDNSGIFKGAMAGKSVTLNNSVKIEQDKGFKPPQIGGATLYERQSYVECTGPVATPPNANC
ncbi:MAG TPA: hypothetical protein VNO20_10770 [Solirubrobacterales bacterium]|nr:hypothetical protein [Solirubrobacterales bacterium]